MYNFQNVFLKDIADSQTGPFGSQLHESDYVSVGTPMVTVEHLGVECFSTQNLPLVSDDDKKRLSKYILKEGDIVFSRVGSIDRCTYVSEEEDGWMFSGRCIRVRVNEKANSRFLAFYFRQKFFNLLMLNISVGATMPSLNTKLMDGIPIILPSLNAQNNIANILTAMDKKILLNNKINDNLEQMAKMLYDYWFVQFDFPDSNGKPYKSSGGKMVWNEELKREIPVGWENGNIMCLANLMGGGTPKTNNGTYWNGNIPFFTPADAENSIYVMKTKEYLTITGLESCSTKLYSKGTLFITARGTIGKVNLASQDMAMNQSCYALQGKEKINSSFLFFYTEELVHYIKSKASGSIFSALVTNDFKFTEMVIPPKDLIQKFGHVSENIFKKVLNNKNENQQLSSLRDWLLPMLMNGQVKIED